MSVHSPAARRRPSPPSCPAGAQCPPLHGHSVHAHMHRCAWSPLRCLRKHDLSADRGCVRLLPLILPASHRKRLPYLRELRLLPPDFRSGRSRQKNARIRGQSGARALQSRCFLQTRFFLPELLSAPVSQLRLPHRPHPLRGSVCCCPRRTQSFRPLPAESARWSRPATLWNRTPWPPPGAFCRSPGNPRYSPSSEPV